MTVSKSSIQELLIHSDFLNETLSTRLYLPPHYSPLYTYPLIVAQDGQDYFNLGRIATLLNQLYEEGHLEKVIVCGVPYPDTKTRWHWFHPDGEKSRDYLHFLSRELLPTLQDQLAVETLGSGVTLLGESLGATVSLSAVLNFPETFGNVILQSPFVNQALLKRCETTPLERLRVYHSIGLFETEVQTTSGEKENFLKPNKMLSNLFTSKTLADYDFVEYEGDHTWGSFQPDLKNALLHFFKRD